MDSIYVDDVFIECFNLICKNFNIPAGLNITEPICNRTLPRQITIFVDLHTMGSVNFFEEEIWKNLLQNKMNSKEKYRKFRSLVRTKLIDAIYQIRNLTEESLRNLGVKEFK